MEEKIITVYDKKYKVVPEASKDSCKGCCAVIYSPLCHALSTAANSCYKTIFQEVTEPKVQQESLIRPPIGIIPLVNHNAMRLNALTDTLQRYAESGSPAKEQWVQEVRALIEYERTLTSEALAKVPFKV